MIQTKHFCISDLPEETRKQLAIIDKSQWYILVIIGAILLSYYTVSIQRKQLICSATDPELCKCLPKTLPFQALSSIMVITALLFYFKLSGNSMCQARNDPKQFCRSKINHNADILVIVAALLRFGLLVQGDTHLDD